MQKSPVKQSAQKTFLIRRADVRLQKTAAVFFVLWLPPRLRKCLPTGDFPASAGVQLYSSSRKGAVKEKSNLRSEVTELFLDCEQYNSFS